MPVLTTCPECGRKLRVPDELIGRKVRCRGCMAIFAVGPDAGEGHGAGAPLPPVEERIASEPARKPAVRPRDEDYDDRTEDSGDDFDPKERPVGRRLHEDDDGDPNVAGLRGNRADWRKVLMGVNFVLISIAVMIASFFIVFMGSFTVGMMGTRAGPAMGTGGFTRGAPGVRTGFIALSVVTVLSQILSHGFKLFGHYLGMSVPDRPGLRLKALSIGAFALFALTAGSWVAAGILDVLMGTAGAVSMNPFASFAGGFGSVPIFASAGLNLLGMLCYAAAYVVFILYLRGVALVIREPGLARTLRNFLITAVSVGGMLFIFAIVTFAATGIAFLSGPGAGPGGPTPAVANAMLGGAVVGLGLGCLGVIAFFGLGIWYIILLFLVRAALVDYTR